MKQTMNAKEVSETLDCGLTLAYQIIKTLNDELEKKGFITIRGRVSTKYFKERFYGYDKASEEWSETNGRSD